MLRRLRRRDLLKELAAGVAVAALAGRVQACLGVAAAASTTAPATGPSGQPTIHSVASAYLKGPNDIHVLAPRTLEPGRRYRVLYVLPVYPGFKPAAIANGQARAERLPDRLSLICISPSFDSMPWYADHPTDAHMRQESHLLKVVVPFVEQHYPVVTEPDGRLLVGYSKSGWGAFTLLLRHPDVFGRAASFDAPLMMGRGGTFRPPDIFGPEENFAQFRVLDLLERRARMLRAQPPRLVVLGHGHFKEDDVLLHERMEQLRIPHLWEHGRARKHSWDSGWLTPAVEALITGRIARDAG